MEYRRFGDKIIARIDKGEEILEQIEAIASGRISYWRISVRWEQ